MIPNNLDEAIKFLQENVEDINEVKKMSESEFMGSTHFFLGMRLRNEWGLWNGSPLKEFFNAMGIYHADDMSGIILTSFYRTVVGQDIKLDEQVQCYKDWWAKQAEAREKYLD